jgi:periplasmic protein TonB
MTTTRSPSSLLADALYLEELEQVAQASHHRRRHLAIATVLVVGLHALLLFGVHLTDEASPRAIADTIEVLLLHDTNDSDLSNPEAAYLAQHGQRGSGTSKDVRHAQAPEPVVPQDGDDPEAEQDAAARSGSAEDDRISTQRFGSDGSSSVRESAHSPLVLRRPTDGPSLLDSGSHVALRGTVDADLVAAPDTRSADVAAYLDGWRHRVERVGTAHYPLEVLRRTRLTGGPTVDVNVAANGHLLSARIARSSGHADLDRAALAIVQLAAPFEPFPAYLAAKHELLRLTYEWHFLDGEPQNPTISLPTQAR